jgi:hypothetical protein
MLFVTTRTICAVRGSTIAHFHHKQEHEHEQQTQHDAQQWPHDKMVEKLFGYAWLLHAFNLLLDLQILFVAFHKSIIRFRVRVT